MRNYSGDKSRGIPPCAPLAMNSISSIISRESEESSDLTTLAAILPATQSFVLGNGTDSEVKSDDSY